jgi:flagella basal body P-ring formation protein FlgA
LLIAAIAVAAAAQAAGAGAVAPNESAVRQALIDAVRTRMGRDAVVRLERLTINGTGADAEAPVVARPEPGSRVGRTMRFALLSAQAPEGRTGSPRIGSVVADVFVAVEHVRASALVEQGETLSAGSLNVRRDEVGVAPLAPLPVLADVIGSRAARDLRPGEVLTAGVVRPQPLVKSGETVRVLVRIGPVEALGQAIAQQSGVRNARIRLINPESRRTMTGRVTSPGEVEVIHER